MHDVYAQDDYINFQEYLILKEDKIQFLHKYISIKIKNHIYIYMYDR